MYMEDLEPFASNRGYYSESEPIVQFRYQIIIFIWLTMLEPSEMSP